MAMLTYLAILFLVKVDAQTYYCFENGGNYTELSAYQMSLQSFLNFAPFNLGYRGFFNFSAGPPDPIAGIALCRADLQLQDCEACVQNATDEIVKLCPFRRRAILWRENCTLRFSDVPIDGVLALTPLVVLPNPANVSIVQRFNASLTRLLDDLRRQAAASVLFMKVAVGNQTVANSVNIYSMVQCTPDISAGDCDRCLSNAFQQLPLNGSIGTTVLCPSCSLRATGAAFISSLSARSKTIIVVVVVAVAGLVIAGCAVLVFRRRKIKKQKRPFEIIKNDDDDDDDDDEIRTVESLQYELGKIRAATDDFSEANELGRGGFGVVYQGILENGKKIAVKRLSSSSDQGDLEFKNEVLVMAKLQHKNLLKILGFTIEGTERLLIYQFAENLSLDRFIFDPVKRSQLGWDQRYKIIEGIAQGLLYLHEDSRFRIIHRDLKPSNVLLDGEMNPQIADFGLARLFDGTETSTCRVVGTHGYMLPPEYAFRGHLSVKIDVYSFGVLILEIISGRKNSSFFDGDREEDMLSFAWRSWQEGTAESMIDPILREGSSGSSGDMLRCIHIGLLCVQENAADRPTMVSVVLMLNGSSNTIPTPPSRPAFFKQI
ncbi:hypothetical protein M569_14720 [Genlisea aurea]|uniref:Receptor-like protein kinase At4g00960 n=1 Tax=Genlisea aurea TaxID=192259 RepID=S8DBH7_9LAMI|nr:hypothetical protein M569_14720 [Genlisea aurea]